ncbi:MAG TPA: cysteinyl-tRNA synthetase [Candidatus Wildermuthbacteria bacterium]|uniref:Cysteinyl-tRNA synthetase-like protein n=1 Tax=Candidatus Yanofskybacteria bacterium GW2011_GWC1_48_11 TaxID=1619027 RepID=A0A837ISW8_9BACT|nr:MAG: Cysteinyl-tRNA synthetase-like protein [Candidatus Yanofskybacteria bacterium GW2011_GWC1_48_11]KKW03912.1 MAG: Cysteinyl-tRNA synthetase-like protein [Parcubacteria group bacterium GW2011_GWB1_49_12]KKW08526.1 MAG: Cysteinyl-tRNA synthetase-like protein [Parcubacteria group bacterium GW2011_GWA1_49_26]KKW14002.1 MAG: Cysteinyl-tRNA synthetase-like protein [Parcubacteria group bacterium GW2011_GWA2_50_10]OHA61249.1 MAG: hypothetical protein A2109_03155 [Candidatus Wildermuthbacteria bac
MGAIPRQVQKLVEERDKLRAHGSYEEGDAIRRRIEALGYEVKDTGKETEAMEKARQKALAVPYMVLFGSGEIAPSAQKVHDRVLKGIGKEEPSVVIFSTPAGFQPNVRAVCEGMADFFKEHLKNYHPHVQIVYANTLEQANNPLLLQPLDAADYIFAGPGSPTYAVRNLRGSALLAKIRERVKAGASLGLASAATMAFSRFCLPVYEIYKAGFDVYWADGLDFYAEVFRELTVIPHFNNNEGGEKHDTSRAWMGKERFEKLIQMLPEGEKLWGIDEHTAVFINLQTRKAETIGKGRLWEITT